MKEFKTNPVFTAQWPADDDNGGYFTSTVEVYNEDGWWLQGETDLGSTEQAQLLGEPKETGYDPPTSDSSLGADNAKVFSELAEALYGVKADQNTYVFEL